MTQVDSCFPLFQFSQMNKPLILQLRSQTQKSHKILKHLKKPEQRNPISIKKISYFPFDGYMYEAIRTRTGVGARRGRRRGRIIILRKDGGDELSSAASNHTSRRKNKLGEPIRVFVFRIRQPWPVIRSRPRTSGSPGSHDFPTRPSLEDSPGSGIGRHVCKYESVQYIEIKKCSL